MNCEDKFHELKVIANNWQNKRLTLPVNTNIIRTLAASQLVYILSSLRTCFQSLKEINHLPFKFLWDGKKGQNQIVWNDCWSMVLTTQTSEELRPTQSMGWRPGSETESETNFFRRIFSSSLIHQRRATEEVSWSGSFALFEGFSMLWLMSTSSMRRQ